MNARYRDRLSFCSAIGIGLGVSTGHPMGIIAADGMPLACLTGGTRKAAFKSTLGCYVAGIWPMVPGLDRYFAQYATSLIPFALRRRCVVLCLLSASAVGPAAGGRLLARGDAAPPTGWNAVNTHFDDVRQPFRDFLVAQFVQQKAAETSARVLIFPESVVPRWSEATERSGGNRSIAAGLAAKFSRSARAYQPRRVPQKAIGRN